jgi:hypothetical protein
MLRPSYYRDATNVASRWGAEGYATHRTPLKKVLTREEALHELRERGLDVRLIDHLRRLPFPEEEQSSLDEIYPKSSISTMFLCDPFAAHRLEQNGFDCVGCSRCNKVETKRASGMGAHSRAAASYSRRLASLSVAGAPTKRSGFKIVAVTG